MVTGGSTHPGYAILHGLQLLLHLGAQRHSSSHRGLRHSRCLPGCLGRSGCLCGSKERRAFSGSGSRCVTAEVLIITPVVVRTLAIWLSVDMALAHSRTLRL
jgi:hypothetical protein